MSTPPPTIPRQGLVRDLVQRFEQLKVAATQETNPEGAAANPGVVTSNPGVGAAYVLCY